MGLEAANNDIDELVEKHSQELTSEELTQLHFVSKQEVVETLSEEEITAKQQSSDAIREMLKAWETVASFLRQILQKLDERLQQLGPDENLRSFSTLRRNAFRKVKRPCFINLPGSDCDNMDIAGLAKDQGHWAGALSPGKKRRKRPCSFNLPGTSCDNSEMIGTGKDTGHWASEISPGRKRSIKKLRDLLHD
ncbi:uncharacterized protein LOC111633674 [Centruroides sculpturatus]|uniref:uncharacterized protein LOC111633674 n=1 Tax=Centruroides sculpturatus TaxID=218467 RepID=UPI000C6ECCFE|nr:uncharacterized protein LOC111633674 [Centruroides sculpturatus]